MIFTPQKKKEVNLFTYTATKNSFSSHKIGEHSNLLKTFVCKYKKQIWCVEI